MATTATGTHILAASREAPAAPGTGASGLPERGLLRSFGIALLTFLAYNACISLVIRNAGLLSPYAQVVDYRVAACAERVVLQRGDVYRTAALRDCEHAVAPEVKDPAWSVEPFALPPYSAALLLPFGLVEDRTGRVVWYVLLVLALCLTIAALAQIIRRPTIGVALILIPTFGRVNLFYGETILFAAAGVALGAWALPRGRPVAAAVAVAFSLIEPAIGLPAVVGLFALVPEARRALLLAISVLGAAGVLVLGVQANVEYALRFIPAHEHAEIFARDQYSLTRVAYLLGANEKLAAALGSASYIATIAGGVVLGRSFGRRMGQPALYVLMPLALSMLGGPFVHDDELSLAMLAALVLARDSVLARVAVALLSVAWTVRWQTNLLPAITGAAGIAMLYLERLPRLRAAGYVAVVGAALLCLNAGLPKSPQRSAEVVGTPQPPVVDSDLSALPWEWRIRLAPGLSTPDWPNEIEKLPLWIALSCLPFALPATKRAAS